MTVSDIDAIRHLAEEQIRIPSVTGTESAVLDHLQHTVLKSFTGEIIRHGHNLILLDPAYDPTRPTVGFNGHVDTVPYGDLSKWHVTQPTVPVVRDGRLYGRGAVDMAGGNAVWLHLLQHPPADRRVNLIGVLTHGEETGIPDGVTELIAAGILPDIDALVVPEPTDESAVLGTFSTYNFTIRTSGQAGHTALDAGPNAIHELLSVAQQVVFFADSLLREVETGVREKLHITLIEGGQALNVIPDAASLSFNFRADPALTDEEVLHRLTFLEGRDFDYQSHRGGITPLADREVFRSLIGDQVGQVLQYWTDQSQWSQAGIPTINLGPSPAKLAHQYDEYVDLDSLQRCYESAVRWVTSLDKSTFKQPQ